MGEFKVMAISTSTAALTMTRGIEPKTSIAENLSTVILDVAERLLTLMYAALEENVPVNKAALGIYIHSKK